MAMMMPPEPVVTKMVVVIIEIEIEKRQPYVRIASIIAAIVVAVVIVVTGSPMTMPSLVTVIPPIPLAAVPTVHLLHKFVAQRGLCCLSTSQTSRQGARLTGR